MWKWTADATPITGVPAQDYDDEAFAKTQLEYERRHFGSVRDADGEETWEIAYGEADTERPGVLERSGLWRHYGPNEKWEETKAAVAEEESAD